MLRRVAVLVALLSPLGAAAQTTAGTMTFTIDGSVSDVLGPATCNGGTSFIANWTFVNSSSTTVQPASGNVYDISWSTTGFTDCGTSTTSGTVLQGANDVTPVTTSLQQTWPQTGTVTPASIVDQVPALAACSVDGVIYFCARLLESTSATTVRGFATGSIAVQVTKPSAPASLAAVPGDGRLHLTWTPGVPTTPTPDHYRAVATATLVCSTTVQPPCDTTASHPYDDIHGTDYDAGGLVNNVPYKVLVYAISKGGLESGPSNEVTETPVPVNDFWEQYTSDGGREKGGCSSGAGGLLGGVLALVGAAATHRRGRRRS